MARGSGDNDTITHLRTPQCKIRLKLWSDFPAEMAGQRVVEQRILLARAAADIVENERHAGRILAVGHDAGVRQTAADHLGEDFARAPVGGIVRSEEHASELQSLLRISYAVFCLT